MHFILPKNYKFRAKLLGLLDYQTAVLDTLWAILLYGLVNLLFSTIGLKIYVFIALFVPFFLFSIVGIHNENIVSVFLYVFKYYTNQKIYLFKKKITHQ